jgi:hypothetical protein
MVTGSEKQIKWYEEILKEAYDYLDARYNHKIAEKATLFATCAAMDMQ